MKYFDIFVGVCSTALAMAWVAWGLDWISTEPTSRTADIMAILWTFQASYFFLKAGTR